MNELLQEVAGWQGYLSRWAVVAQVLAMPLVWVVTRALARWSGRHGHPRHRAWRRGVGLLLLGGLAALLALSGHPAGLLAMLTGLIAGWHALELVQRLLAPRV